MAKIMDWELFASICDSLRSATSCPKTGPIIRYNTATLQYARPTVATPSSRFVLHFVTESFWTSKSGLRPAVIYINLLVLDQPRTSADLIPMSQSTRTLASGLRRASRTSIPQLQLPQTRQTRCLSLLACRHHEALIRMRKDAIRQRIQDIALSRRKFSCSTVQRHGHLDPPKPGEECVLGYVATAEIQELIPW